MPRPGAALRHFAAPVRCGSLRVMNDIRDRLQAMRDELRDELRVDASTLARDIDEKGEDTTPSQHPADVASDLYAREELVAEQLTLRRDIAAIDDALLRLRNGTYGRCVECGKPIGDERLAALPYAARCIGCQRRHDATSR